MNTATFEGFFASPRQNEEITATVTVNQQQYPVKTKVTILAPCTSLFTQTYETPPVASYSVPGGLFAKFQWEQGSTPGISFTYYGDSSAGSGTYMAVQVINVELATSTCAGGYSGVEPMGQEGT
ncbi:MAG: hypothetical protein ACOZE5_03070 [Verrucomicrobiota bacterium]